MATKKKKKKKTCCHCLSLITLSKRRWIHMEKISLHNYGVLRESLFPDKITATGLRFTTVNAGQMTSDFFPQMLDCLRSVSSIAL